MKADGLRVFRAWIGLLGLTVPMLVPVVARAQESAQGRWADANDPVAAQLIEQERRWATASCAPPATGEATIAALVEDFIAPDFVGTSPKGALYAKADMLPKDKPAAREPEKDCQLLSARVRFIGADVAIIYGKERATIKSAAGTYAPRTLVWTDTLLQRSGKWQVIAVQDMVVPTE